MNTLFLIIDDASMEIKQSLSLNDKNIKCTVIPIHLKPNSKLIVKDIADILIKEGLDKDTVTTKARRIIRRYYDNI